VSRLLAAIWVRHVTSLTIGIVVVSDPVHDRRVGLSARTEGKETDLTRRGASTADLVPEKTRGTEERGAFQSHPADDLYTSTTS